MVSKEELDQLMDDADNGANSVLDIDLENQHIGRPNGEKINFEIDEFNEFGMYIDVNKLLVPTPPVYKKDENDLYLTDANGNYIIEDGSGMDPNVSTVQGLIQSFYDAPGGFSEEFNEINWSLGAEYWYDQQFALRLGYFYENPNKGNRNHMTLGLGLKSVSYTHLTLPTILLV